MYRLLLACAVIGLLSADAARAGIGDTPERCQARYGKPVRQQNGTTFYGKDSLSAAVTFAHGKAGLVRFHQLKEDAAHVPVEMTIHDFETLLNANGAEHGWMGDFENVEKIVWSTEENSYLAIYDKKHCELSIISRSHKER